MNTKKLRLLIRNIRDLKYPKTSLQDISIFKCQLARDLDTDTNEAMALLGYLLTKDYVVIVPGVGLIANPGSKELQELITSGELD